MESRLQRSRERLTPIRSQLHSCLTLMAIHTRSLTDQYKLDPLGMLDMEKYSNVVPYCSPTAALTSTETPARLIDRRTAHPMTDNGRNSWMPKARVRRSTFGGAGGMRFYIPWTCET